MNSRVVHGSQSVEILKTLPLQSGEGWTLKKRVVGVHENSKSMLVIHQMSLVDTLLPSQSLASFWIKKLFSSTQKAFHTLA